MLGLVTQKQLIKEMKAVAIDMVDVEDTIEDLREDVNNLTEAVVTLLDMLEEKSKKKKKTTKKKK